MRNSHGWKAFGYRSLIVCLAALWAGTALATVDFTLRGLDGEEHTLSDYRGKWVVVNYWATWCPPCREEMPELTLFHEKHQADTAVVLGINMEDLPDTLLRDFVEDNFVGFPILLSTPDMATVGPVPGLPTTYLISPEGEIAGRHFGKITADELETFIDSQRR